MTLRSGEGGTEWPDADGDHPHDLEAENGASTSPALMWLELAQGVTREALVERLAQAHMSGVLREGPIQTPHGTVKEP